jgi:hypothetical protein
MEAVEATFDDEDFEARVEALAKLLGVTREEALARAFTSGLPAEEARLAGVMGLPDSPQESHD